MIEVALVEYLYLSLLSFFLLLFFKARQLKNALFKSLSLSIKDSVDSIFSKDESEM